MKKLRLRNVVCPGKASSKLQSQDSNTGHLTLKTVLLRSHYMAPCQDVYQAHTVVLLLSLWCPQELISYKESQDAQTMGCPPWTGPKSHALRILSFCTWKGRRGSVLPRCPVGAPSWSHWNAGSKRAGSLVFHSLMHLRHLEQCQAHSGYHYLLKE